MYTLYMVYTVYMVYMVYTVYTVYTEYCNMSLIQGYDKWIYLKKKDVEFTMKILIWK